MAARILLADSRDDDTGSLAAFLSRQGLATECLAAGELLLQRLAIQAPALVVLHRRVRAEPDLTVLRRLRMASAVPVMLRAMDGDDEVDRVLALEIGADDYLR